MGQMLNYRILLDLYRPSGDPLGRFAATVDWGPACEATWFQAVRNGHPASAGSASNATIAPLWHESEGKPYLSGFRVGVATENGEEAKPEFTAEFRTGYFLDVAEAASAQLVEQGVLQPGERFQFRVAAVCDTSHVDSSPVSAAVRTVEASLPLEDTAIKPFLAQAEARGPQSVAEMPVFIPARILDEAAARVADAGKNETGGILIGRLARDVSRTPGEIFLQVTAQIPARHAIEEKVSLTFTAETWTAVRAAVDLRNRTRREGQSAELMVGWWHSHPFFCRDCPQEKRQSCAMYKPFFSTADEHLHRTVFPKAYSVALVLTASEDGLVHDLYGWHEGAIRARGYHVVTHDISGSGHEE